MGEMISTDPIPYHTQEAPSRGPPSRAEMKYFPAQEPWDLFRPIEVTDSYSNDDD